MVIQLPGSIDEATHSERLTPKEIVRELAFHVMVERGLADSDAKRVISDTDMAHRIRSWRK